MIRVMHLLLLIALSALSCGRLIHVPLSARPASPNRLFSHAHRPWAPRQSSNISRLRHHAMYGNIVTLGEYYVTLLFGGQPLNVQVDTGSSTIAVPLKQCKNCRKGDHRLDLDRTQGTSGFLPCGDDACRPNMCSSLASCSACAKSTNACCAVGAPDACGFFLRYADDSGASGALIQADVTMGGVSTPLVFGGILKETESFENDNVDGILGMAYDSLACNPTCVEPLFDRLVSTGKVSRDVFSICTAVDGGLVTLGGSDPNYYEGELKYVDMSHGRSYKNFYDVKIQSVKLGGRDVSIPQFSNAIVDSGTTVLVVTPAAYASMKSFFQTHYCHVPGLCPGSRSVKTMKLLQQEGNLNTTVRRGDDESWFGPGYCVLLSDKQVSMLPDITISLDGIDLVLDPDTYMLKYVQTSGFGIGSTVFRCLGISSLPGLESMGNDVILGNTMLIKYFVEYDRENDRLGFAKARNCLAEPGVLYGDSPPPAPIKTSRHGLPRWLMLLLAFAAILAWVILIYICGQEARRPAGYSSIPASN